GDATPGAGGRRPGSVDDPCETGSIDATAGAGDPRTDRPAIRSGLDGRVASTAPDASRPVARRDRRAGRGGGARAVHDRTRPRPPGTLPGLPGPRDPRPRRADARPR